MHSSFFKKLASLIFVSLAFPFFIFWIASSKAFGRFNFVFLIWLSQLEIIFVYFFVRQISLIFLIIWCVVWIFFLLCLIVIQIIDCVYCAPYRSLLVTFVLTRLTHWNPNILQAKKNSHVKCCVKKKYPQVECFAGEKSTHSVLFTWQWIEMNDLRLRYSSALMPPIDWIRIKVPSTAATTKGNLAIHCSTKKESK